MRRDGPTFNPNISGRDRLPDMDRVKAAWLIGLNSISQNFSTLAGTNAAYLHRVCIRVRVTYYKFKKPKTDDYSLPKSVTNLHVFRDRVVAVCYSIQATSLRNVKR